MTNIALLQNISLGSVCSIRVEGPEFPDVPEGELHFLTTQVPIRELTKLNIVYIHLLVESIDYTNKSQKVNQNGQT